MSLKKSFLTSLLITLFALIIVYSQKPEVATEYAVMEKVGQVPYSTPTSEPYVEVDLNPEKAVRVQSDDGFGYSIQIPKDWEHQQFEGGMHTPKRPELANWFHSKECGSTGEHVEFIIIHYTESVQRRPEEEREFITNSNVVGYKRESGSIDIPASEGNYFISTSVNCHVDKKKVITELEEIIKTFQEV